MTRNLDPYAAQAFETISGCLPMPDEASFLPEQHSAIQTGELVLRAAELCGVGLRELTSEECEVAADLHADITNRFASAESADEWTQLVHAALSLKIIEDHEVLGDLMRVTQNRLRTTSAPESVAKLSYLHGIEAALKNRKTTE